MEKPILGVRDRLLAANDRQIPSESRSNLPFVSVCGLVCENAPGGWWVRQDSNLQPDRYERDFMGYRVEITEWMRNPFRYFKTSPDIIRLTVMMYVRFPLSPS